MEKSKIWGEISMKKNSSHDIVIQEVQLSVQSSSDILSFSVNCNKNSNEEAKVNRVIGTAAEIHLLPALPDRTLIVKPKKNLSILPSTRFKFYVYLPVTFQLYAGVVKPENKIFEHALANLSSTWFGEPHDGELCYALYSSFDTEISSVKERDSYVICPIEITNASKEVLEVKRLAVRGVHLNIYSNGEMMISNKVKINYLGLDPLSNVTFSKGATSTIPNLKQIATARVPEDKTILKRSFQLIRHITQF